MTPDPARPTKHAFIEPVDLMQLSRYELNLEHTRIGWGRAWP